jgi:hypothetical protein
MAGFFQVKQKLAEKRRGDLTDFLNRLSFTIIRKQFDLLAVEAQSTFCDTPSFAINQKRFQPV